MDNSENHVLTVDFFGNLCYNETMEELNLKEFFLYLRKYIVLYALILAAALTGTYLYDTEIKTDLYQSKTSVILAQSENSANSTTALNDVNVSQKLTTTYGEVAKSELVLQKVIDNLNLDMSVKDLQKNIKVTSIDDTAIITISVKNEDAAKSAEIANEIANVFSDEIVKIYKLDNVSILDIAKTPDQVANNTTVRDMIIAAALSIFGVTALAFLLFYLDDTVKYHEDIERELKVPIAGKVVKSEIKFETKKRPQNSDIHSSLTSGARGKISDELVVEKRPKAIVSENIKSLRTNLQFTSVDKDLKTILVTSTNAGEGKSFVASNLAASFAQADKKVLLVDCDLRKGRLHKLFNVSNLAGLSNLLMDEILNIRRYIQNTGVKNLSIITRGTYPPNPAELLSSEKNKALIERLKQDYDIIIFDGTPCNGLADSIILSTLVDETIIITKDATTPKASLNDTKESLEKVGANIAGVVFNGINKKVAKYYSYYGEDHR